MRFRQKNIKGRIKRQGIKFNPQNANKKKQGKKT